MRSSKQNIYIVSTSETPINRSRGSLMVHQLNEPTRPIPLWAQLGLNRVTGVERSERVEA
ncbi:hypothetical protein J6590_004422 [Homalodisca vitripennis]|nr:hypothetical protein J6590_004422 [Homalodisca vitripennis]